MTTECMNSFSFSRLATCSILGMVCFAASAYAADTRTPEVRVFDATRSGNTTQQSSFLAFDETATTGGSIATGDVNGDGKTDIVVGSGPGETPVVKVFSRKGKLLSQFTAYAEDMTAGVNVAVGDLNGDGTAEIVTGTGLGGGPQVRVFDMNGNAQFTDGFFAFDEHFRGGVNVAVGNVDGGVNAEIIAGAGSGGGPHVRVFRKNGKYTGMDFFPFASSDHGGVTVAAGNVDDDPEDEIIMGMQSYGQPWVKVYNADETIVSNFLAYSDSFYGGVTVAAGDINRDGKDEIITSVSRAGGPQVRMFTGAGNPISNGFFSYETDFRGGVSIAAANMDTDNKTEIVTLPRKNTLVGRADLYQYIEVDLSQQTLYAYKNGNIDRQFLVSTGISKYPTPTGLTYIDKKIPLHEYKWSYGLNNPDNYDLPNVPWNLRFRPNLFIHDAYWHNNFGHPMSHGCVNVNLENSKWTYDWASIGTPVWIHE